MKKLILLLIFLPVIVKAQELQFGINGGLNIHTKPAYNTGYFSSKGPISKSSKSKLDWLISAKGSIQLGGSQLGLGLDYTNLSYDVSGSEIYTTRYHTPTFGNLIKPMITPYIFLQNTVPFVKSTFYYGLSAGLAFIKTEAYEHYTVSAAGPIDYEKTTTFKSKGYVAGLQFGYTLWLKKKVGINAEVAPRILIANGEYRSAYLNSLYRMNYWLIYCPVSVGIRYEL